MFDIRAIQATDIQVISQIEVLAGFNSWSTELIKQSIESHRGWVAVVNDTAEEQLVAYLFFQIILDEAELLNIAVHPQWQGNGCAKQLLSSAVIELIDSSIKSVFLEVAASNTNAVALYKGLKFKQTGIRKNYYNSSLGKEDALLMQLTIK